MRAGERKTLLSEHEEAMMRLVHAKGNATLPELLTAYQARPMTAGTLRDMLRRLTLRGWLDSVRGARAGRTGRVAWAVSDDGMGWLLSSGRLPYAPPPLGKLPDQTPLQQAPVDPPRLGSVAGRIEYMPLRAPIYVPPKGAAMRAGALDFLKLPSHGRRGVR